MPNDVNAILYQLQASLLVTCYDPGALLIVSPADGEEPRIQTRNLDRPMGMSLRGEELAIATRREIISFRQVTEWQNRRSGTRYEANDALFLPRKILLTGEVDMHDLCFATDGTLWGVNTAFSCLCTVDDTASWIPQWLPKGMPGPKPGDWYHVNGLALRGNQPAFATSLGRGDAPKAWREKLPSGGILWDVVQNEPLLTDLAMPHSPRLDGDILWVLLSASGEIIRFDTKSGRSDVLTRLPAIPRGMCVTDQYLIIASSPLRKDAFAARHLYLKEDEAWSGIWVVDKRTGVVEASLRFAAGVRDLFEVTLLPSILNPAVVGTASPEYHQWITTSFQTWGV